MLYKYKANLPPRMLYKYKANLPPQMLYKYKAMGPPQLHFPGGPWSGFRRFIFLGFAPRRSIREIAQQRLQLFILPRPERPLLLPCQGLPTAARLNDSSQFGPPTKCAWAAGGPLGLPRILKIFSSTPPGSLKYSPLPPLNFSRNGRGGATCCNPPLRLFSQGSK